MSQRSAATTWWCGDAGLGLALHGLVQSDLVRCFVREFKTTSHI